MNFIDNHNISTFQVFKDFIDKYKQVTESKYSILVNQPIRVNNMDYIDEAIDGDFWFKKNDFEGTPYTYYCNYYSQPQKVYIIDNTDAYSSINFTDEEKHALIAHEIGHFYTSLNFGGPVSRDDENEADDFAISLGFKSMLKSALEKLVIIEKNEFKKNEMNQRIIRL